MNTARAAPINSVVRHAARLCVRISTGVALFAVVALCGAAVAAGEEAISRPVLGFQQTLIATMKDGPTLGFAGRKQRMQGLVDAHFDMPAISRAVIGRHFEAMAATERVALQARINEFAVATLASRFRRFGGEQFEPPVLRDTLGQRARLSGRFIKSDGAATQLTYDVSEASGQWRITNISFGGVSGTDIQRAEFETFLRDGGAARLRKALDALIADLQRDTG